MEQVHEFLNKAAGMAEMVAAVEPGPIRDRHLNALVGYLTGLRDAYQVVTQGMEELVDAAADDGD